MTEAIVTPVEALCEVLRKLLETSKLVAFTDCPDGYDIGAYGEACNAAERLILELERFKVPAK